MNVSLSLNGILVPVNHFTFKGGEEQVQINTRFAPAGPIGTVSITAKIKNSTDFFVTGLLKDACSRLENLSMDAKFILNLPYIPYARQDRVMNPGESLAIKFFTGLINNMGFDKVVVDDPHSDVSAALLNNVQIRSQDYLIQKFHDDLAGKDVTIIAPDAGARKKAQKVAERFCMPIVEAGKVRDVSTGEITGTAVFGDVSGRDCVIVDDIADGAFTFLKLGEELKKRGAKKVILYVTHGIFSKGIDILNGYVDEVYAYHPWMENIEGRNEYGIFKETSKGF